MINCRLPDYSDQNFKMEEFDPQAPTDMVKRVNRLHKLYQSTSNLHPKNPGRYVGMSRSEKFFAQLADVANTLDMSIYNKKMRMAVEQRSLDAIGRSYKRFKDIILGTADSPEGATVDLLVNLERRTRGYIAEQIRKVEIAKAGDQLKRAVDDLGKRFRLNADEKAKMMWDAVEIGFQPYMVDAGIESSAPRYMLLAKRQDQYLQWLQEIGMNQADIDYLTDAAKHLAQTNAEVAKLAGNVGLEIGELADMGYFARTFLTETDDIMKIIRNGGILNNTKVIPLEAKKHMTATFQQSRQYFDFVPADAEVLDYFFRSNGVYDAINKQLKDSPSLKSNLGLDEVKTFDDLLSGKDDVVLSHAFVNLLDPHELDIMVELGYIDKVPWQTSKVHQYLQEHYKLPFGLSEAYLSDPVRAVDLYIKQLKTIAGNKTKLMGTLRGALSDGWGVPRSMVDADPGRYKGFVPLSNAYSPAMLDLLGADAVNLDDVLVPREVAGLIRADLTIATNPTQLGMFSNVMKILGNFSTSLLLGTPQWLGRQIFGWAGTLLARGVSPVGYYTHVLRQAGTGVMKRLGKVDRAMDYGSTLTEAKRWGGGKYSGQDLWREAIKKGLVNEFNEFGEFGAFTPRNLKRTVRQMAWMYKEFPEHFGKNAPEVAAKAAREMLVDNNPLNYYLSMGNTLTDNMGRFSLLEAVMSDNRAFIPDLLDPIPHITDIDEAIDWVFHHTWNFDDMSVGGKKWYNEDFFKVFVPFITWRLKNMQQAALFATEHPHLFGSYLYLVHERNERLKEERPVEKAILSSSWIDDADFPIWMNVPGDMTESGQEEWFMFPATNVMTYMGAVSDVIDIADSVFNAFNKGKLPSQRSDNPFEKRNTLLQRFVKEETMPTVEALVALYSQEDNWGRSFEDLKASAKKRTILGIEIDPVNYYLLTTFAPNIKQIDRLASYTGITGESAELNPFTGEFTEGKESWTGVTPDYPVAAQGQTMFSGTFVNAALQMSGMQPYHVNIYEMANGNLTKIEMWDKENQKMLRGLKYKLANARNPEHAQEIIDAARMQLAWAIQLGVEYGYYKKWQKKVGLPNKKAIDAIMQQNLNVADYLTEEEKEAVRQEIYRKYTDSEFFNR